MFSHNLIQKDDEILPSPVNVASIVLPGHPLQNFLLRPHRADSFGRSINHHDVLGPKSAFRHGVKDQTFATNWIGHDLETGAPRTVIEHCRNEPVPHELARQHIPEIPVRAPALKNGPPIGGHVAKSGLRLLGPEKDIYNPHALQSPASPYQLMAGTVIAASLVTGLNSDLPGFVIARVTENVFDTVSGRHLLIPQGSRLVGKYDNIVAFGQERALVVWQRIILPDGTSVVIDNLPATDTGGYAGLADQVDFHTWKLLKGVALVTVLGVGSELTFDSSDSDLIRALQQATQATTNRAGQRLIERQLNVQPTITVRPGWPLRIIVHKDILLRPYRGPTAN
jgi:type IV secretory pathway VirB10-like protein